MKKVLCLLMVIMMMIGCAFAECGCGVPDTVRMAMYTMSMRLEMSDELFDSFGYIVLGGEIGCEQAKLIVLTGLLEYYEDALEVLTDEQMGAMVSWLTMCECGCGGEAEVEAEVTPVPTVKPTKRPPSNTAVPTATPAPHVHSGGTHDNGGVCTGCGQVYQEHVSDGAWESRDSTWHYLSCVCGVTTGREKHRWDGKSYGTSQGGLVKRYCTVCHEYSWVRVSPSTCCEKCNNCCAGCSCGCGRCGK